MKLKFEEFKLPNAKFFLLQDESELKLAIAKIGTIKKIYLPQKLISLKITARIGNKSVEAKDWSTREGVVELIWENHFFKEKTTLPIDLANALSEQIFELE